MTLLTIIPYDLLRESALPILATLGVYRSWFLEVLFPPRNTRVPPYFKLWLSPGHFSLFMPGDQQTRQEVIILTVGIDDDRQEVIRLLLYHSEFRSDYV